MLFRKWLLAMFLGITASTANAAMVLVGVYDGVNDGINLDGTPQLGDIIGYSGSMTQLDRVDWDYTPAYDTDGITPIGPAYNPQTSGDLTIEGTVFNDSPDVTEALAGNWSYTGSSTIDYITFKFDNWLAVYQLTEGTSMGSWDVNQLAMDTGCCTNNVGIAFSLSHSAAYTVSAVPVPAAVWLFGSGLISLWGLMRRK